MRARRRLKRKYKRFLAVLLIDAAAIIATPKMVTIAAASRGYNSIGGEILLPVLVVIICWIVLEVMKDFEKGRRSKNAGANNITLPDWTVGGIKTGSTGKRI